MTAADRMRRDVRTIPGDESAWAALAVMRGESVRHLVVVDSERMVGILSNRDFRRILDRTRPDGTITGVSLVRVRDLMTPAARLVTVRPDTPIVDVARLLAANKVGCVPVIDAGGQPIGILAIQDIMAALLELLEPAPPGPPAT
jgi:CBS domain-containing membrane protein